MPIIRTTLLTFVAIASILPVPLAAAAGHPVMMWELQGESNRIYILGSVHLLRDKDYPIPSVIYDAYEAAETLIMELDMDDMDPQVMQSLVMKLGMIENGRTLQDVMGQKSYAEATKLAQKVEIPLEMLAQAEPWLAAITVEVMLMTRLGFDPTQGIETHLMGKASVDGKQIHGLETEQQQLEMLDNLSPKAQRELLLQTLSDGAELEGMLDEMIAAWRHGNTEFMEDALLAELSKHAELHNAIVVKRNRDWVRQIDELLDDRDDYLIVVGALHLVGKDGVPALLTGRGLDVQQMQQIAN